MNSIRVNLANISIPVVTEIINSKLKTIYEAAQRLGSEDIPVPQTGDYLVRVHLPSGEFLEATVTVTEDKPSEVVSFSLPAPSPHEWLQLPYDLGEVAKPRAGPLLLLPATWLCLWSRKNDGSWQVEPELPQNTQVNYDPMMATCSIFIYLPPPMARLFLIQIGGPQVNWRFISVPPLGPMSPKEIQVIIQPAAQVSPFNAGVSAKVFSREPEPEALLRYFDAGALNQAERMSQATENELTDYAENGERSGERVAEILFREKLSSPNGAAIAGYFLLRSGALERFHNWPNNFANWIDWLPDSAVIHAWQLLRDPAKFDPARARKRLLDAVARGLPMYSEGIRLLIDGLELFAEQARSEKQSDEEVEKALAQVRMYATAVDWQQTLTTYYGATPERPSLEFFTGTPENQEGLLMLNP